MTATNMIENRRKVYVVMVADLFHCGHVEFLKRAREHGDYLVVGLVSDDNAAENKRTPVLNVKERKKVLEACRYVDEVRIQEENVTNEWLKDNGFAVKVHAVYDEAAQALHRMWNAEMGDKYKVEVPYEYGISTSEIIERIKNRGDL